MPKRMATVCFFFSFLFPFASLVAWPHSCGSLEALHRLLTKCDSVYLIVATGPQLTY